MNKKFTHKSKYFIFFASIIITSINNINCFNNEEPELCSSTISENKKFSLQQFKNNTAKITNLINKKSKIFKHIKNTNFNVFSNDSNFLILHTKNNSTMLITLNSKSILEFNDILTFYNIKIAQVMFSHNDKFLFVPYNNTDYLSNPYYYGDMDLVNLENKQITKFKNIHSKDCNFSGNDQFLIISRPNNKIELTNTNTGVSETFDNTNSHRFINKNLLFITFNNKEESTKLIDLSENKTICEFKKNLFDKYNNLNTRKRNFFSDVKIITQDF